MISYETNRIVARALMSADGWAAAVAHLCDPQDQRARDRVCRMVGMELERMAEYDPAGVLRLWEEVGYSMRAREIEAGHAADPVAGLLREHVRSEMVTDDVAFAAGVLRAGYTPLYEGRHVITDGAEGMMPYVYAQARVGRSYCYADVIISRDIPWGFWETVGTGMWVVQGFTRMRKTSIPILKRVEPGKGNISAKLAGEFYAAM